MRWAFFNLEPDLTDDSTPYHEVLNDYVAGLSYEFGDVFYRDRRTEFPEGRGWLKRETHLERHKDSRKSLAGLTPLKRLQTAWD